MAAAKTFLGVFLLTSLTFLPIAGCVIGAPALKPHLYAGDSANDGFTRKQSAQTIRCNDPQIDDLVAMSYADLQCNYKVYVLGCAKWKPQAFKDAAQCNIEQLKRLDAQKGK